MRHVFLPAVVLTVLVAAVPAFAVDLVVDGTSQTLGGTQTYDNVSIVNGGVLNVATYDGDPTSTGLLHLVVAGTLTVDASSSIIGDGRGYQGQTNANGDGPGGGQGGACCYDSGGGGGYGGTGGTGSRDNSSAPDGVGGGPYGASDSVAFQMGWGGERLARSTGTTVAREALGGRRSGSKLPSCRSTGPCP